MSLGDVLARPLLKLICELPWRVDIVAPVPMGADREAARGYNQAALLAIPVALGAGTPYQPRALKKVRDIQSQVGLSVVERYENVEGAFKAHESIVKGQSVLVIDDTITSGATMDACSEALLSAGAREVYGLTLARSRFI
jgi:ComF family protein